MSPDEVAKQLARTVDATFAFLNDVFAYHIQYDHPVQMLPKEWGAIVVSIDVLEAEIRDKFPKKTIGDDRQGYAEWRQQSPSKLPAGVFMWRDEFERGIQEMNTLYLHDPEERDGEQDFNYTPLLPDGVREIVLDGFSRYLKNPADSLSTTLEMPPELVALAQKPGVLAGALAATPTSDTDQDDKEAYDDGQADVTVAQAAADAAKAENEDAALFDPVTSAALEKMFPADGKWAQWHAKAKERGLDIARDGVGKYNPYRAATWWLDKQAPQGWDIARCRRTLAKNFPARSRGLESQFTGGEIE